MRVCMYTYHVRVALHLVSVPFAARGAFESFLDELEQPGRRRGEQRGARPIRPLALNITGCSSHV